MLPPAHLRFQKSGRQDSQHQGKALQHSHILIQPKATSESNNIQHLHRPISHFPATIQASALSIEDLTEIQKTLVPMI